MSHTGTMGSHDLKLDKVKKRDKYFFKLDI